MSAEGRSTILYVDDDPANRQMFGWLLRTAGYEVKEAATGTEALRLVGERPDLVILDVNLPDVNGFEVCRRIKAHPATTRIPVLHMSAVFVRSEDRTHGLEEGADGYLVKPVEPREVLATVKALLRVHEAEEAARAAARDWQVTFDALSEAVCLLDADGTVRRCNRAAAGLLGHAPEELVGRRLHALAHHSRPDGSPYPEEECPTTRALRTGRGCRVGSEVFWRRDGTAFPVEYACHPVVEGDAVRGAVVTFTDITQRRRLEEHLRQAQKMEAIGRLAGGVAHDFNNLLTVITGNLSLTLTSLPPGDPHREALQAVDRAAWRAAELVRQLLGFSRQTVLWLQPTDLNSCVGEVVGVLRRTIDPRVVVEVRTAPDLWAVRADPGQLNQVLLNLCLNARDAMPAGGRLLLETANLILDEAAAAASPGARPGEFVRLRVADTGEGIPADVLPRIFDPYFTTKEAGKGTGLGLAMVFGIVQQHRGWIVCTSAPGRGAAFDIYLPRLPQPTAESRAANPEPPPARGTETVLLVDDDAAVRHLGQSVLEKYGYRVLTAEDGGQALDVYRRGQERVDLVILDMTMPRLSGLDTLHQLRETDPGVRVLFTSGYTSDEGLALGEEGVLGFIPKPYAERDLARAVRGALDRAKA
jgi:PAS domain S-box-containing protein